MVSGLQFRKELQRAKSTGYHSRSKSSQPNDSSNDETTPLLGLPPPDVSGSLLSRLVACSDSENRVVRWLGVAVVDAYRLLASSYVHMLLVFLPFSLLANSQKWPSVIQFVLSFFSIIPLSSLVDSITYEISLRCGLTFGGLVVAVFGNTVEIVFLQASLLGHIICVTLFGLGLSFTAGGSWYHQQDFTSTALLALSFSMAVATFSIALPTIFNFISSHFGQQTPRDMAGLSRGTAIVLLLIYFVYLYFQLRTHTELFDGDEAGIEEEEYDEPTLHPLAAPIALVLVTYFIAICSQSLVGSIGAIVDQTHSSRSFVGFLLIPLYSNAVLIFTAVRVALLNNMDLAVSVAIASVLQIVLFVTPTLVVLGWIIHRQMTLAFGILEVVVLLASSLVMVLILQNGRSSYLDGVLCLGMYAIIVMAMFVFANDLTL